MGQKIGREHQRSYMGTNRQKKDAPHQWHQENANLKNSKILLHIRMSKIKNC